MYPDSPSVLFVTSDPALAAVYRLKLEMDEYSLSWAEPQNALDLIQAVQPDLIYLDIDSADGHEILRGIQASNALRGWPLIVITRRPEEVEALLPGPSDPVHVISLARSLDAAVTG
jgi:DNA-binding response OmpR family regulator